MSPVAVKTVARVEPYTTNKRSDEVRGICFFCFANLDKYKHTLIHLEVVL